MTAKAPAPDALDGFCDVHPAPTAAPDMQLPELAPASEAVALGGLRWVNLWATWCKPCVEEMPMITRWQTDWKQAGHRVGVAFVAVEGSDEEIAAFRAQHPQAPTSRRLADPAALAPWMEKMGLDAGAGLPLHVFMDASSKVRCVRAGAITLDHRRLIESLVL